MRCNTTTLTNSTVSGNSASYGGGVLNIDGLTVIEHSTITHNTAPANQGSGVATYGYSDTPTRVRASLIAANTNTDVDFVSGATNSFDSDGDNLIGDGNATGAFTQGGDQIAVADPGLGPLADNGGRTLTHAPHAGSPAIDAVTGTCPPPNFDQRGEVARPQDGNGDTVAVCDIGSVEVMAAPSPDLSVGKTDSPDPVVVSDHLTYTITVNNAGAGEATGVTLSDTLPSSVDFVSVTCSDPSDSCGETVAGTVECDLGDMVSGDDATVTLVVQPTETGTITNSVTVASPETDDNPGNNTATAETAVTELLCNGLVPTLVGTPGNDSLHGTIRRDVIHGLGGDDTISGGLIGKDVICGGEGNDPLRGGISNDRLFGENGTDTLKGNLGNDALDGGTRTDTCKGGLGRDTGTACEIVSGIP